jgi:hypothetical protein
MEERRVEKFLGSARIRRAIERESELVSKCKVRKAAKSHSGVRRAGIMTTR